MNHPDENGERPSREYTIQGRPVYRAEVEAWESVITRYKVRGSPTVVGLTSGDFAARRGFRVERWSFHEGERSQWTSASSSSLPSSTNAIVVQWLTAMQPCDFVTAAFQKVVHRSD